MTMSSTGGARLFAKSWPRQLTFGRGVLPSSRMHPPGHNFRQIRMLRNLAAVKLLTHSHRRCHRAASECYCTPCTWPVVLRVPHSCLHLGAPLYSHSVAAVLIA